MLINELYYLYLQPADVLPPPPLQLVLPSVCLVACSISSAGTRADRRSISSTNISKHLRLNFITVKVSHLSPPVRGAAEGKRQTHAGHQLSLFIQLLLFLLLIFLILCVIFFCELIYIYIFLNAVIFP